MVGFLLHLSITGGMRGAVSPHGIFVLICHLRAGRWFEEGSHCGSHLSNPSVLLKFLAQPRDIQLRGVSICVCICTPQKKIGWGGRRKAFML